MYALITFVVFGCTVANAQLKDCDYNGVIYHDGARFMDSQDCNSCFCANGAVACTLKLCLPKTTCTYNGTVHNNGDSFKSADGCNTCGCQNGQVVCTEMFCLPPIPPMPTNELAS